MWLVSKRLARLKWKTVLYSHDLIPNCLLLHLEAGRNLETFIASTFGYKPSSSTQKSEITKNAKKKRITQPWFAQFFLGITYFGWYLVNPHVQAVQNMYAKARLQFSKYRFHNESASSHDLWKATNSLWNWYFQNCGRACFLDTSYFANGLHFYALNKLSISCYDIFFVKSAQPSGPLCFLKCF